MIASTIPTPRNQTDTLKSHLHGPSFESLSPTTERIITHGLSWIWPETTLEGGHCSESADWVSPCWSQFLGPLSHHRACSAIQIPEAAPCLSSGWRSRGRGNVDIACHLRGFSLQHSSQCCVPDQTRIHGISCSSRETIPPYPHHEVPRPDHVRPPSRPLARLGWMVR